MQILALLIAIAAAVAAVFSAFAARDSARTAEAQLTVNSHFGLSAEMIRGTDARPGRLSISSTGVLGASPDGKPLTFLMVDFKDEAVGGYARVALPVQGFYSSQTRRGSSGIVLEWREADGAWIGLQSAAGIGGPAGRTLRGMLRAEYSNPSIDVYSATYVIVSSEDLRGEELSRFLRVSEEGWYKDAGHRPERCRKFEAYSEELVSEGVFVTPSSTPTEMQAAVDRFVARQGRTKLSDLANLP